MLPLGLKRASLLDRVILLHPIGPFPNLVLARLKQVLVHHFLPILAISKKRPKSSRISH